MYNLATQLVKMGHEPIVFCESERNGLEWINGFKVIHQKDSKVTLFATLVRIESYFKDN